MVPRAWVWAISGLVISAAPTAAQFSDGPSILTLLPISGELTIGDEVSGSLTSEDFVSESRRVQAYSLEGAQGAPVTIDLVSDDFDSYLYLLGPDGAEIASDDDSGGQCHARIATFLPSAGVYRIVVSSLSGSAGTFTLRTDDQQAPPATGDCGGAGTDDDLLAALNALDPVSALAPGDVADGALDPTDAQTASGSYLEAYRVSGTPGQSVVIDLTSMDMDVLLYVLSPRGDSYAIDDDSGGACNARMEITLDMQPHLLVASTFSSSDTGSFQLSVSERAGPMANEDCPGSED